MWPVNVAINVCILVAMVFWSWRRCGVLIYILERDSSVAWGHCWGRKETFFFFFDCRWRRNGFRQSGALLNIHRSEWSYCFSAAVIDGGHFDLTADCTQKKKKSLTAHIKTVINTCRGKVARAVECPPCEAQTDKLSEGNQDNDFHLLNKQILIICLTD